MVNKEKTSVKKQSLYLLIGVLVGILVINWLAQHFYTRIDLTSDKRYSLLNISKETVKELDDIVFVRVFLSGEMPLQVKKFERAIRDRLDELQVYAGENLQYEFSNPADTKNRDATFKELVDKGLEILNVTEQDNEGGIIERTLVPGALVYYNGKEFPVNFVKNNVGVLDEQSLNIAEQNIEYELVTAIYQLSNEQPRRIAFINGHGELNRFQVGDISVTLSSYFKIDMVTLSDSVTSLDEYAAVIVAKPTAPLPEAHKLILDQYVMNGGRIAWFIDAVTVHEDSLTKSGNTFAFANDLNLTDQLFTYGVRINTNIIQDAQCAPIPVNMAPPGRQTNFQLMPWPYVPLLNPPSGNPITKGVNLVKSEFPGVIDTVGKDGRIKKTFLLRTSAHSKTNSVPLLIQLADVTKTFEELEFNKSYLPVAVLLEGEFESVFKNRMVSHYVQRNDFEFKAISKPTRMVVVSDGDIIRNNVSQQGISPLGYDRYTHQTYGNSEFVKNVILYLTDENGLMELRTREFTLRLLDKSKVINNRTWIILANTLIPVVLVVICGILFMWIRKRKYAR